jgi:hypothetical protein
MLTSEDIEHGWRCAIRDVAVRLRTYAEFVKELDRE